MRDAMILAYQPKPKTLDRAIQIIGVLTCLAATAVLGIILLLLCIVDFIFSRF